MHRSQAEGWPCLQELRSHLSGRLCRFKRDDAVSKSLPGQEQNETDFFEADLRYILTLIPTIVDIPDHDCDDLDRGAHGLLTTLNDMVNQDLIETLEGSRTEGALSELSDVATLHPYTQLCAMLALLETSSRQFNLVAGQDLPLFLLPDGHSKETAVDSLAYIKDLLERLANGVTRHHFPRSSYLPQPSMPLDASSRSKNELPPKHASVMISRVFNNFQQRSCGKLHEIKLKVPDDRSGSQENPLDMFLSCCVDQTGWHQAQCGTFLAGLKKPQKDGICAAIQRAKTEGRSIYLSFDEQGLFEISDAMPAKASSSTKLTSETLKDLLDQKALTRITPSDYGAGTAIKKLSSRDKATIALSLAKCLLEFFDEDMDLAFHSWKPECIYFLGAPQAQQQDRALYISLRPTHQKGNKGESLSAVGLGNPVLLSFAKLLLEIDTGERIAKEIQSESTANLETWVWMCGFVDEVERNGGGNYLRAVEGCLYLHVGMRQAPGHPDHPDDLKPGEFIRQKIYKKIVRNLELVVNPQSSKRKLQDSVSELPLSKKLSINPSRPDTTIRHTKVPFYNSKPRAVSKNDCPASRAAFEVAIVCALPLEFDAVSAIVDEFWNKDYGRVTGDENIYTNARIGKLNVILLLLSNMGKVSAASTCANLRSSYPGVSLVLMSGICGGVPISGEGEEILLGDVIISRHIVQYDLGRQNPGGFETRDTVEDRFGRAPKRVRNLLALLGTNMGRERLEGLTATCLQDIQTKASKQHRGPKYQYPGALKDQLFEPTYYHQHYVSSHATLFETCGTSIGTASHKSSCKDIRCDTGQLVLRERIQFRRQLEQENRLNEAQAPSIFIGTIGSGDTVMKSGEERDRIARAHNLLAFEMEGAGVWDEMPCIIIKGVCDYADSHKNKDWQHFAAATAASATKALLSWYIQRDKLGKA